MLFWCSDIIIADHSLIWFYTIAIPERSLDRGIILHSPLLQPY